MHGLRERSALARALALAVLAVGVFAADARRTPGTGDDAVRLTADTSRICDLLSSDLYMKDASGSSPSTRGPGVGIGNYAKS